MEKTSIKLKKVGDAVRCWNEINQKLFVHAMKFIPQNEEYWVTISQKRPTRTEAQSRYYHMYKRMIADETGEDEEVLHEIFKNKFLGYKDIMYHATGQVVRIWPSTKELSIKEFMKFIKDIEIETGVIPPDTEVNGLAYYVDKV